MFRHFRQNLRDRLAAVYVIVFKGMSIYRKSHIGSRMTCTLGHIGYAYACLKLQADRSITKLMWVIMGEPVLFQKLLEPHSDSIRLGEVSGAMAVSEEYRLSKPVPLAAVLPARLHIVGSVLFQHFHDLIIHIQTAFSCCGLTALVDMETVMILNEMPAYMYTVLLKINIVPGQRTKLTDTAACR